VNSIFIRIYGGMLASMLLVSVISYLFLTQEDSQLSESYPKALLRGTIHVLSQGFARTEADERLSWHDNVQQLLGAAVVLKSVGSWVDPVLSRNDIAKLQEGDIIIRGSNASTAIRGWVANPDNENLILHVELEKVTEKQLIGLMKIILSELGAQDTSQWESFIKKYQTYFGARLSLRPILQADWTVMQLQDLRAGRVVMRLQNGRFGQSTMMLSALTPDGSEIVELGPINIADMLPYQMFIVYGIVAVVIMGLASYYVVRPLLNRLLMLEETVVKIRRHDLSARVTVDSNDMLGRLAATFNDMAEHIQRLIHSQREMTNAVSHELRTPVARIRFGLEFLEDEDVRSRRVERIQDIDGDIQELERLIDEILTYASLEEGTPSLKLQMVRVDDILSQVKKESDNLGRPIEVEHVVTQEEGESQYAECEERYIHRVVQNLVGNAMNYGDSKVRISSACEAGMYRIDVEDDGPGIPPDKLEKVFVPFARLDDSRTRSSGGYGLGLSIVQRIAYWHGGLASVSRSSLGGAKFTVLWPRKQSLRKTAKERSSSTQHKTIKGRLWPFRVNS
jgi:two-component system sensor histidine kinase RstB